ncbi:MAG: hypothetical protein K0R25_1341 [Rickettsiaceae bacterium]|jgi:HPt (histidine-containing phosphotransfer) domain-containing protein|nr:hypothetical protein [Rickettsiaceae bacterium]
MKDKKFVMEDPIIDRAFLEQAIQGDKVFEKEIFTLFINSSKTSVATLEKALEKNDNMLWNSEAHFFKGTCSAIGAFPLSKVVEYAQFHFKDNAKDKQEILDEIKKQLEEIYAFINKEILK